MVRISNWYLWLGKMVIIYWKVKSLLLMVWLVSVWKKMVLCWLLWILRLNQEYSLFWVSVLNWKWLMYCRKFLLLVNVVKKVGCWNLLWLVMIFSWLFVFWIVLLIIICNRILFVRWCRIYKVLNFYSVSYLKCVVSWIKWKKNLMFIVSSVIWLILIWKLKLFLSRLWMLIINLMSWFFVR